MIENNSIQLKYPLDYSNKVFDGRIHTVIPLRLESFFMKNNKFYLLNYVEKGKTWITVLGKNENGKFFKIPLDDYSYLFDYLGTKSTSRESLDMLKKQYYVDTIDVQKAKELFLTEQIQKKSQAVSSPLSPPNPPRVTGSGGGGNNPPNGPTWNLGGGSNPPNDPLLDEDVIPSTPANNDKEKKVNEGIKLYVGRYGYLYAAFVRDDRNRKNLGDNKFIFYRYPMDEVLNNCILSFFTGNVNKNILIDYDENGYGEKGYSIKTDLRYLIDVVQREKYVIRNGIYKYDIVVESFTNYDDFAKFKSSESIECTLRDSIFLSFFPETHTTTFINLANSQVEAKFQDSYGDIAFNSFSESLNKGTSKGR